jgi:drug/metabolite transporter (DMT)-like permease
MIKNLVNRKAYVALAIVSFFWGTTYLVSRIAVQHIPGLMLAGVRNVVAGGLLVLYFIISKHPLPDGKTIRQSALIGFVMVAFSSGLSHWSVQYISGGLAAIIGATIPLWMALFALAVKNKKTFSMRLLMGLLLGFGGILIIFYDHLADMMNMDFRLGILLALVSCITWSAGSIYTSNIKLNISLLFGTGLQMLFAGCFVTIASYFTGHTVAFNSIPMHTWMSIFYLIIIGSILTYSCYVYAVMNLPPERVGVYAYINPIVAILLGRLLLHEKLNVMIVMGTCVTIVGVYLVNSGKKKN